METEEGSKIVRKTYKEKNNKEHQWGDIFEVTETEKKVIYNIDMEKEREREWERERVRGWEIRERDRVYKMDRKRDRQRESENKKELER